VHRSSLDEPDCSNIVQVVTMSRTTDEIGPLVKLFRIGWLRVTSHFVPKLAPTPGGSVLRLPGRTSKRRILTICPLLEKSLSASGSYPRPANPRARSLPSPYWERGPPRAPNTQPATISLIVVKNDPAIKKAWTYGPNVVRAAAPHAC
jgi:hypothetical protein